MPRWKYVDAVGTISMKTTSQQSLGAKPYKIPAAELQLVAMLNPSTHFSPIRITAYVRNEVEMEVAVRNEGQEPRWVECDVSIPEAISLAPDRLLTKGRMRIGIALPRDRVSKKIRIYGGASSYPDTYTLRLTLYGYAKDGSIAERYDIKSDLRCERGGQE